MSWTRTLSGARNWASRILVKEQDEMCCLAGLNSRHQVGHLIWTIEGTPYLISKSYSARLGSGKRRIGRFVKPGVSCGGFLAQRKSCHDFWANDPSGWGITVTVLLACPYPFCQLWVALDMYTVCPSYWTLAVPQRPPVEGMRKLGNTSFSIDIRWGLKYWYVQMSREKKL